MSFGLYLQEKRKEHGYTQEKMAELLGVDKTSISRYENDKMFPEITILKIYRTALGLSRDEFYEELEGEHKCKPNGILDSIMGELTDLEKQICIERIVNCTPWDKLEKITGKQTDTLKKMFKIALKKLCHSKSFQEYGNNRVRGRTKIQI